MGKQGKTKQNETPLYIIKEIASDYITTPSDKHMNKKMCR